MKRIALLVCGILLLVCNTAEARRSRTSRGTYTQPVRVAPATYSTRPAQPTPVVATATARPAPVVTAAYSTPITRPAPVVKASYSTSTAQGVANIMASTGRVGHWGGNPGYEGCGMGASPAAAYNTCCYSNSGMTTVDVGYARGANGMWYCCRRYR
jgi:hypothetical protein